MNRISSLFAGLLFVVALALLAILPFTLPL